MSLRPPGSIKQVLGQPGLQNENLSKNKTKQKTN